MNRGLMYIVIGATLWGTIGFFVKNLYTYHFTPMEIVTIRVFIATIILLSYLLITAPKSLRLHQLSDLKYFIGTGIMSIIFFNYCMFKTIELATIPISAALLYTAPAFVIVLSYFLFKEVITLNKLIALGSTLIGVALVVGLTPLSLETIPAITIIIGLGSGFGYALYSIFSKLALRKYSSLVITTYTFLIATLSLIPFFPYQEKVSIMLQTDVLFYIIGLGLLPTAIAYIVYTKGLERMEASKAAILSTLEPVVATLIGIFVFSESFFISQFFGMALILGAVILLQLQSNTLIKKMHKKRA